ncbi:glycosyltransferase family 2 protein [Lactiplantibacillus plantarum]|nr:glycosyltransferase family 2 protein [Lactiplantibacillus plantarum]MCG0882536.1 glycosyltransferase family 2 protein [Lactiplantibacillus plantarum]
MNRKLLSIVVPAYNSSRYITRLIEQLNNIVTSEVEVIYCDDGSSDLTTTIILKYARNAKLIKLEHNGVSNARNVGIKKASGKYITFIDSDDLLKINEFKNVINLLEKCNYDLVNVSKNISFKHNRKVYYKDSVPFLIKALIGISNTFCEAEIIPAPWAKFYKRQLLVENQILFPIEIQNGEDLIFNCNVLQKVNTVYMFKNNFYLYKNNIYSLSHVIADRSLLDQNKKRINYCDLFLKEKIISKSDADYLKVKILINSFLRYYRHQARDTFNNEEKKELYEIKKITKKEDIRRIMRNNLPLKVYIYILLMVYTPLSISKYIIHLKSK